MNKFIPKTNEDLIKKMNENKFKGNYYIENNIIIWNISNEVFLEIILNNQPDEGYIDYGYRINNKTFYIAHDHPEMEELYELLEELNKETNTLVIKKTIFGKSARLYFEKIDKFDESKFKNNNKYEIYKF